MCPSRCESRVAYLGRGSCCLALCGNGLVCFSLTLAQPHPLRCVHPRYAHGIDKRIFLGTIIYNRLSIRRPQSRPVFRPPTAGRTLPFDSPQMWWGLPRCAPIKDPRASLSPRTKLEMRGRQAIYRGLVLLLLLCIARPLSPILSSPSQPSQFIPT